MERNENCDSICKWADETFGNPDSILSIATRAGSEYIELIEAIAYGKPLEKVAEEAADIIIVLQRIFPQCGTTAEEAIDTKMAKNRIRSWRKDGFGHGQHTEV